MLLRIFLMGLLVAVMGGCTAISNRTIAHNLDKTSKKYCKMIRWNELDQAEVLFPSEKLQAEFKQKVIAAQGVKVTDVRIKKMECFPERGEATIIMDIDYYREPSITLKTVEDKQEWKYVDEDGNEQWRLMTLPPDFP
ncbi:MAG TPA: hypothetical protein PLI53_02865 [Geobacteraceae bacterium]|nr:hypothetical protein [Geobacteraceae bacterium]